MDKYFYNKDINLIEVLPEFIKSAIKPAKLYRCGIRIIDRLSIVNSEVSKKGVVLDFLCLNNYTKIPSLTISDDLDIGEYRNIDTLYELNCLEQLSLGKISGTPLDIDISKITSIRDLRCDYTPKIKNIGQAINLERLYIWSYKAADLSEFKELIKLKDFMLIRPSIKSLDGIEDMTELKTIDISYARNLKDISALRRLNEKHKVKNIALPEKFWLELLVTSDESRLDKAVKARPE